MRLQRNQLRTNLGRGREALEESRKNFLERPDTITLHLYLNMLLELQKYEELLSVQETEPLAQEIICPVSEENLSLWWLFIHAAAETGAADFIERHAPSVLAACGEKDEFSFLRSLLPFYQKTRLCSRMRRYHGCVGFPSVFSTKESVIRKARWKDSRPC